MRLTQKIKIKPSREQETLLWILSEKNRLIYNFALKERRDAYEKGIKGITYLKQQNDLPEIKTKYPEYKWVYSHALQYTLRQLNAEYKSFFALRKKGDKSAKTPKFKSKEEFCNMVFNHGGFKFGRGIIAVSHKHPSGIKLAFRIPEKFIFDKIVQVNLCRQGGEFYIAVTYEKQEKEYIDNGLYQAFDLGVIKHTAVNLAGRFKEFKIVRPDKYWSHSIQELQRRLSHTRRGSHRWNFYKKTLNRLQEKSANQMKDLQHKMSREIIDNTKANTIILGDLAIKEMAQESSSKGLSRSLHNTGSIARFVSS